ncbi:MAG TPA: sigma-54 dependent transcriptional regulator, partial [Planctomycetota bacterium]|nr:sigma-54 dependent transcriptional regulator [Planctomycetota bacterium]
MPSGDILIIDDDPALLDMLKDALTTAGWPVTAYTSPTQGLHHLQNNPVAVVVVDLHIPEMNGLQVVEAICKDHTPTQVLVMTGNATVDAAVKAMKLGSFDFLTKPLNLDVLLQVVERAAEKYHLTLANVRLADRVRDLEAQRSDIVIQSPALEAVAQMAQKVAATDATVLITGESGVGKEVIADIIQSRSQRKDKPYVKVNCTTLTENLLESELFGHEKGSFTGAIARRIGRFEQAHRGTLFLDEIGDLSPNLQAKMLRTLQFHTIDRVGGDRTIHVDVRVVCATNKDLVQLVRAGSFREDLFYRLNVFPIQVPPLRERVEDIRPLVHQRIAFLAKRNGRPAPKIPEDFLAACAAYGWPGNVRELENAMERVTILAGAGPITRELLPREVLLRRSHASSTTGVRESAEEYGAIHSARIPVPSAPYASARGAGGLAAPAGGASPGPGNPAPRFGSPDGSNVPGLIGAESYLGRTGSGGAE